MGSVGCANLTHEVQPALAPVAGADRYLEHRFAPGAGAIAPGANSGEVKLAVNKDDWSAYNEIDDYSYLAEASSWTSASNVALYRNGVLVWGTEPGGATGGTGGASGAGGASGTGGASSGGSGGTLSDSGGTSGGGAGNTTSVEFSVQLPVGVGLHTVAVGATQSLVVADAVVVTAADPSQPVNLTSVGSSETNLGSEVSIDADVVSVGPVKLRDRGAVHGNVTTGSEFRHDNLYSIGPLTTNATLTPFQVFTWTVEFGSPVSVDTILEGETTALVPGSYQSVNVNPGGTLELSTGVYTMESFVSESESTVRLDTSTGPVVVYVMNTFAHRGQLQGGAAEDYFIGYAGEYRAEVDARFAGTVVAPNAYLRLSPVDGTGHEGSFFGKMIEKDARNPLTFVPFGHWEWVIPPRLLLECLSRSGSGYGAGLFGYENVLDIPVEIPEGARNFISNDTRREQGPLTVFEPGEHRRVFALPFRGDAIAWTLGGATMVVDNSATRCKFDDFAVVKIADARAEALAPLPTVLSGLMSPPGAKPPLVDTDTSGLTPAPDGSAPAGLSVLITGVGIGDECDVGSYDVDVKVYAYQDTDQEWTENRDIYNHDWEWSDVLDDWVLFPGVISILSGTFRNLDEVYSVPTYPSLGLVPLKIILWERDDGGLCGDDDHEVEFRLHVDPTTLALDPSSYAMDAEGDHHTIHQHYPIGELNPPNGDPNMLEYCAYGDSDWGMCFQLLPAEPTKLCAQWPVQFLDGARGEDVLASTDVQYVPASFARVRLDIQGGAELYSAFPPNTYRTLDADGCLPQDVTPSLTQLTPVSDDFEVKMTWLGALSIPAGSAGEELEVQIERLRIEDQWAACGCEARTADGRSTLGRATSTQRTIPALPAW